MSEIFPIAVKEFRPTPRMHQDEYAHHFHVA
jgi:hypothetical protein